MKVERISASAIRTFNQCPLKYWAIYVAKMPEGPPHPLTVMGSAIHRMLEKAVIATREEIIRRQDVGVEPFDPMVFKKEACDEFKVETGLLPLLDELVGNAKRWGYFRNVMNTVGCEMEVEFTSSDGTKVRGFIDRLDVRHKVAEVIDVKTQKEPFTEAELRDNWQARIYNIGARNLVPSISGSITVSFWVLRHQVQKVVMTPDAARRDMKALDEKINEIRSCESPMGKPSGLCPWCPYHKDCPAKSASAKDRLRGIIKKK